MSRIWRSVSIRLALGYAGLFILSSFLLVGFLWWQTASYLDREINAVIVADTRAIGDRLRDFGLAGAVQTIAERIGRTTDNSTVYLLTNPALTPIIGNVDAWPADVSLKPGWYQVKLVRKDTLRAIRILNVRLPGNFHLLVGRDVQSRVEVHDLIVQGLAWAAAIAILLAIAGGLLTRRSVLRRVEAINRTALAIVQGDLSKRVPTRNSSDEFDQLTRTINAMLGQIQLLVEGVRNTSNAIAHDLRTPLTELRSRLEGLLARASLPDPAADEIHEAVADIDRLIAIFNALLRLAEIDSGVRASGFCRVELADLVDQVSEVYSPIAEEKEITFAVHVGDRLGVNGDPYLLAQAVGNLVDNAVKYTPPYGKISVVLEHREDGRVAVKVADSGPGIPPDERAKVTDRFYRGDVSRKTPGVGLGLSLVAAVARLHGGALEFDDNGPGLIATLLLPAGGADTKEEAPKIISAKSKAA